MIGMLRWAFAVSAVVVACRSPRTVAAAPITAPATASSAPVARALTRIDKPFAVGRSCADIKPGYGTSVTLDTMPAKLRVPKKIAPPSREYLFSSDGSHVLYADAKGAWMSVPVDGGASVPASQADIAALQKPPPLVDLVRAYQAATHGDVTPLSARYLAIGLTKDGAEHERMFIADLDRGELVPTAPDGFYTIWQAQRVDDHRVAFIGRDHHMYVADAAARTLSCASLAEKGDIQGFYRADADRIVFLAGHDIHVADLDPGVDHTLATLPKDSATVVFGAVPGKRATWVVHVERRGKNERQLFLRVDGTSISRITNAIAGWSNLAVSSRHVMFDSGDPMNPDARPPKPPPRERL